MALALSLPSLYGPSVSLQLALVALGHTPRQDSITFHETHSGWKRPFSMTPLADRQSENCLGPGHTHQCSSYCAAH